MDKYLKGYSDLDAFQKSLASAKEAVSKWPQWKIEATKDCWVAKKSDKFGPSGSIDITTINFKNGTTMKFRKCYVEKDKLTGDSLI